MAYAANAAARIEDALQVTIDAVLAGRMANEFFGKSPSLADGAVRDPLSRREAEVIRLIADGYSNKEIAAKLAISVKTVETYKARVMEKLNLRSRHDVVRYAAIRGWLTAS